MKTPSISKLSRLFRYSAIGFSIAFGGFVIALKVNSTHFDYKAKTMDSQISDIKMKSICVGRFQIDVPDNAVIAFRGTMVGRWKISTYEETDEAFKNRVEKKEAELSGAKNERGMPTLERTHRFNREPVTGKYYVFGREWIPGLPNEGISEAIRAEAMIRIQNRSFNLSIKDADERDLKEVIAFVSQFRSREQSEIPQEAGFCFDGGFITEPLSIKQSERTTLLVGLPGNPDVSIMLDMTAGISTAKTLLERDSESKDGNKNRSRFHTLRRGSRALIGKAGQEVLERVHEFNGNYGHSFMWENSHNDVESVYTPLLSFEMMSGNGSHGTTVNASLTDAQAVELWDKMLTSLRLRTLMEAKPD